MTNEELILRNQMRIMQALMLIISPSTGDNTPKSILQMLVYAVETTSTALEESMEKTLEDL